MESKMNYNEFFSNLVADANVIRLIKAYIKWIENQPKIEVNLRPQQKISVYIYFNYEPENKLYLKVNKTTDFFYVQFWGHDKSYVNFVEENVSGQEVDMLHSGRVCRFRVYNDEDLKVLIEVTKKYLK